MTFKELYLSGQVEFEEIDRFISRWNNSDDERTLAKYLGLNAEEEDVWIDDSDEALQDMLDSYERWPGLRVTLGRTGLSSIRRFGRPSDAAGIHGGGQGSASESLRCRDTLL